MSCRTCYDLGLPDECGEDCIRYKSLFDKDQPLFDLDDFDDEEDEDGED